MRIILLEGVSSLQSWGENKIAWIIGDDNTLDLTHLQTPCWSASEKIISTIIFCFNSCNDKDESWSAAVIVISSQICTDHCLQSNPLHHTKPAHNTEYLSPFNQDPNICSLWFKKIVLLWFLNYLSCKSSEIDINMFNISPHSSDAMLSHS